MELWRRNQLPSLLRAVEFHKLDRDVQRGWFKSRGQESTIPAAEYIIREFGPVGENDIIEVLLGLVDGMVSKLRLLDSDE